MEGTRNTIIKAFKLLLDEKPMTKITVKDVVEQCGINRNTFYYHFQDIPTLFQRMMEEKAEELIENHYQPDEPIECIRPLIQYGVRNRRAILHVYRYVPRETFLSYLNRIVSHFMQEYFASATEGASVAASKIQDLAHFYKCAITGILLEWLDAGLSEEIPQVVERLCVLLKGSTKAALTREQDLP